MQKTTQPQHSESHSLQESALDASGGNSVMSPPAFQLKADGGEDNKGASGSGSGAKGNLPENLVSGFRETSGHDLSDVNVHYNSSKPAQLKAHAFAQGNDIHLGPGTEKHLSHEAAHVIQQREGRVKATTNIGGAAINDDAGLEREADQMGDLAARGGSGKVTQAKKAGSSSTGIVQRRAIVQEEQEAMNKIEAVANESKREWDADENHESLYEGIDQDMKDLKTNIEGQIQAVPETESEFRDNTYVHSNDPGALRATLFTLAEWTGNAEKYAKSRALPGNNISTAGAGTYKCNRLPADAYATGAGMGYDIDGKDGAYPIGERSWPASMVKGSRGYPPSANELGNEDKSIPNMEVIEEGDQQMGDIIAFPYEEGIGHTGINLSDKLYISARNSEARPAKSLQPADGIQLTKIPGGRDITYRRVDADFERSWETDVEFNYRIPKGNTVMRIRENSDLRVQANGSYGEGEHGLQDDQLYFDIKLHSLDGATDVKSVRVEPLDQNEHYVFQNVPIGSYYFELIKPDTTVPLKGSIRAETVNEKEEND